MFSFGFFYKRETGISLLEKYGFLKALKKYNTKSKLININDYNFNNLNRA